MKLFLMIVFMLLITADYTKHPVGGVQFGTRFEDTASCVKGKIIYRDIDSIVSWEKGTITIQYSWQCYVSNKDNKRYYKILGTYDHFKEMSQ